MLMENGLYDATVTGAHPFIRTPSGKLTFAVNCQIGEYNIVARENIELNDGSLSQKTLDRLRMVFPNWDGTLEGLYIESVFVGTPVTVEIENVPSRTDPNNGKTYSQIKWLNPAGSSGMGGHGDNMPDPADRAAILAKYGSKFRAVMGGSKSSTPPANKPATSPAQAPAASTPPAAAPAARKPTPRAKAAAAPADTPTMQQCWDALKDRMKGQSEEAITGEWYRIIDAKAGGKENDAITPAEWKEVMKDCQMGKLPA